MLTNSHCDVSPYEDCTFTGTHLTPSSTATFNACNFTFLTSSASGGAISFTSGDSLTIEGCIFAFCYNTISPNDYEGGGAVHATAACTLIITYSLFIECSTPSYGGGVHAQRDCKSSTVSFSTFIGCNALYGAGLMTYGGPSSSVSSSRFISCTVTYAGGAFYHSGIDSSRISLTNSLFTRNTADTVRDGNDDLGGGALKDVRTYDYSSHYSFSFFSRNIAETNVGHDIVIHNNPISDEDLIHCFTTTSINAFSYVMTNHINWLPQGLSKLFIRRRLSVTRSYTKT